MKIIKKISFSLFLLISLSYLFIVVSPKIFKGFYPFGIKTAIVLTGSMYPTLEVNDFVIMKKPDKIEINDIVSYKQLNSDSEVLHRIIQINNDEIVTKGDANNKEDSAINIKQITGVYVGKVKYLGDVIIFVKKPIVFSTIITFFVIIMILQGRKGSSSVTNKKEENNKKNNTQD